MVTCELGSSQQHSRGMGNRNSKEQGKRGPKIMPRDSPLEKKLPNWKIILKVGTRTGKSCLNTVYRHSLESHYRENHFDQNKGLTKIGQTLNLYVNSKTPFSETERELVSLTSLFPSHFPHSTLSCL